MCNRLGIFNAALSTPLGRDAYGLLQCLLKRNVPISSDLTRNIASLQTFEERMKGISEDNSIEARTFFAPYGMVLGKCPDVDLLMGRNDQMFPSSLSEVINAVVAQMKVVHRGKSGEGVVQINLNSQILSGAAVSLIMGNGTLLVRFNTNDVDVRNLLKTYQMAFVTRLKMRLVNVRVCMEVIADAGEENDRILSVGE